MAEATTAHALRRALARAGAGKALSAGEIESLLAARGPDLERLMSLASHLRELGHGGTVTYSRKVFVPLTMLCRDHCHYCTFAKPPARLERPFLSPEEVVAIAEAGRRLGCKEALFTLGDRPEERYPVARDWLAERGYRSTLEYVRAAAIRVIEETGLLPHLNPGVMSYEEMARLKQVAPSMGMMLETSSDRLSAARRAALRLAGQGPRRPSPRDRGRRAPGDPVHHRHPRRDRRDPGRARRVAPRDPRAPSALPPRPGGHRPELPGQARDGDARRARAGGRGVPGHRRDGAGRVRTADARPGAAEPVRPRAAGPPPRGRDRRLGRRLAAHARPREPRAPVAGDRGARPPDGRSAGSSSASDSRSTRSSRCGPIRSSRARCGRRSRP